MEELQRVEEEQRIVEEQRLEEERRLKEQQKIAEIQRCEEEWQRKIAKRQEQEEEEEREKEVTAKLKKEEEEAKLQEEELLETLQEEQRNEELLQALKQPVLKERQKAKKRGLQSELENEDTRKTEKSGIPSLDHEELEQGKQQQQHEYQEQLQQQKQNKNEKANPKNNKEKKTEGDQGEEQAVVMKPNDISDTCLSSLLTAPTREIKAQVDQISEVLKEPIKNPHHVSKEAYEAYKSIQPPSPSTQAPVLSRLLGTTTSPHQQVPCKTTSQVSTRSKKSPMNTQQSTITQFFNAADGGEDKEKTYPTFSPSPSDNESPTAETKRFPAVDSELYTNLFSSTESTPSNETFNISSPIKAIVEKSSPHSTPLSKVSIDANPTTVTPEKTTTSTDVKTQLFPLEGDAGYEAKRPPNHSLTVDVGESSSLGMEVDGETSDSQS